MKDLVDIFAEARFGKEAFFKKLFGPAIDPRKKAIRDQIEDMIREEQLKRDKAKTQIAYGKQRIEEAKKPSTFGLISDIARGMVPGLSITAAFDDPMIKQAITAHPGQYLYPLKNRIADVLGRVGSAAKKQIVARAGDIGDIGMKVGGGLKAVGKKGLEKTVGAGKYLKKLPLGKKLGGIGALGLGGGLAASAGGDEEAKGRAYDIAHALGTAGGAGTGYAIQKGWLGGQRGAENLRAIAGSDLAKKMTEELPENVAKAIQTASKGPGMDLALAAQSREGLGSRLSDLFSAEKWKRRLGLGAEGSSLPKSVSQARTQLEEATRKNLTSRLTEESAEALRLKTLANRLMQEADTAVGASKIRLLDEAQKATTKSLKLSQGVDAAESAVKKFFSSIAGRGEKAFKASRTALGDIAEAAGKKGAKKTIPAFLRRGGKWGAILGGLGAAGLIGIPRILKAQRFRASGGAAGREAATKAKTLLDEAMKIRGKREELMKQLG